MAHLIRPHSCLKVKICELIHTENFVVSLPFSIVGDTDAIKVHEYCRQLVIEHKVPLFTIFKALQNGVTTGKIVSRYLPPGFGRDHLINLFQYFATKKGGCRGCAIKILTIVSTDDTDRGR